MVDRTVAAAVTEARVVVSMAAVAAAEVQMVNRAVTKAAAWMALGPVVRWAVGRVVTASQAAMGQAPVALPNVWRIAGVQRMYSLMTQHADMLSIRPSAFRVSMQ